MKVALEIPARYRCHGGRTGRTAWRHGRWRHGIMSALAVLSASNLDSGAWTALTFHAPIHSIVSVAIQLELARTERA